MKKMIGIRTGKQIRDEMNEYADTYDCHDWDNILFIPVFIPVGEIVRVISTRNNEIIKGKD